MHALEVCRRGSGRFIVEGATAGRGLICPKELPRAMRDKFIAECGRRDLPITRTETVAAN